MSSEANHNGNDQEFRDLESQDEYARYFNQLCSVFRVLIDFFNYQAKAGGEKNLEAEISKGFLHKLLFTIEALRIKYTYNPRHNLSIDLTDSGFPSFTEVSKLNALLRNRNDQLARLPSVQSLKQAILSHLLEHHEDTKELLWQLGERSFYEMIDFDQMMLDFTPGEVTLRSADETYRTYLVSWACYDFNTNRPYLHIMICDQDVASVPLEEKGFNFLQLIEVIKAEGSRVPPLAVLATGIDTMAEDIHPKVIKRTCLGPICTPNYSRDPEELCALIETRGEAPDDFIVLVEDEIVFSKKQTISNGFFSKGKIREIFSVPETDLECYDRKVSRVHKYLLAPHRIIQHLDTREGFPQYADHQRIPFEALS